MYTDDNENYIDKNGYSHRNDNECADANSRINNQNDLTQSLTNTSKSSYSGHDIGYFILVIFPIYFMYKKYKWFERDYDITFGNNGTVKDKIRFHINYTLWLLTPFIIYLSFTYRYFYLLALISIVPLIFLVFYSNTDFKFLQSFKNILLDSTTLVIFFSLIYFWMSANFNKNFPDIDKIFIQKNTTKVHAINENLVNNFIGVWDGIVTENKSKYNMKMSIEYSGDALKEKVYYQSRQCTFSLNLVDSSQKMLKYNETVEYGFNICQGSSLEIIFNGNDDIACKWYGKDGSVVEEGTFHKKKV